MKKLLAIVLSMIMLASLLPLSLHIASADDRYLEINEENFPDPNFRQVIIDDQEVSGGVGGYYMTEEQVLKVGAIYCNRHEISSVKGIEHFPNLGQFECVGNAITEIDVSNNPNLYYLSCDENQLTKIDVSNNPALEQLYCGKNQLTILDVSNNPVLYALWFMHNKVTKLVLSEDSALTTLYCTDNMLNSLDLSNAPLLKILFCENNQMKNLNVSGNPLLEHIDCRDNALTELDVSKNINLGWLECTNNCFTHIDVSKNTKLEDLFCDNNLLTELDVSNNAALTLLSCEGNQLTALDVSKNESLEDLFCKNNRLTWLDLTQNPNLHPQLYEQTIEDQLGTAYSTTYTYDLTQLVPKELLTNVELLDWEHSSLDTETGIVTFDTEVSSFIYDYDTGNSSGYLLGTLRVEVQVAFDHVSMPIPGYDATIEWDSRDIKYKGKTPYVIANGKAQEPRFTVKDTDGNVIDPANYDGEFYENVNAGTAILLVTFKNEYTGLCYSVFKIYLPATSTTTVANVKDGIKLTWSKVAGADGYVIYRRAWSSTTNGWTDFVRWNNTKELNWLDTKVYAGTRYQYGIKAYFNKRIDPVTGAEIGGNVGDNFNLGEVGPLKTTVRITTRTLNSVTAGSKQMTVKWGASSQFTGYQIQYATNSAFTQNAKTVKITNPKTASTVIKNLLSGKTYYVRVRSYHEFNGMTYFGEWSNVKSCKVK